MVHAPSLFIFVVITAAWLIRRSQHRFRTLPPTLPGLPLLGNVHQMPLTHLKLDRWKDKCGPIYSLNLAGQIVVVLGSAKVAADILDRMSAFTSGRPPWIMGAELMSRRMMLSTIQYGEEWRRHRRGAHEGLQARAAEAYYPVQEDEALRLVQGLLSGEKLDDLELHMTRTAASTIWRALYGGPPLALVGDTTLDEINDIMTQMLKVLGPGGAVVDVFPFLMHLPKWLAPFKRFADRFHRYANGFFFRVSEEACHRRGISGNSDVLNLSASLHEKQEKLGMSRDDISWLGGMIFIAGAETSATALQYFVLAMTLYPDVARKAQNEIDEVVGWHSLPTLADRDRLPYVQAVIKEVLRWRPVVAVGVPHAATEDFVYEGYTIPKGNITRSICRDPELFPDFDIFRPERFLTMEQGGVMKEVVSGTRFDDLAFGYGRRICVGRDFAMNSLFIDIATMLWSFEFRKARDASGKKIVPSSMDFHDTGGTVRPAPFPFELVPRSEAVASIVSQHGKEAS